MSARLTSSFFVAAHLRRCASEGVVAVLRRRGSPEAGAIFIKVDRLDGTSDLYGPTPQSLAMEGQGERRFARIGDAPLDNLAAEEKLAREIRFDSDLWILEIEDRAGRTFLDIAPEG